MSFVSLTAAEVEATLEHEFGVSFAEARLDHRAMLELQLQQLVAQSNSVQTANSAAAQRRWDALLAQLVGDGGVQGRSMQDA